ncbi:unnamed protein product, partial [Arabidopsis halleri]
RNQLIFNKKIFTAEEALIIGLSSAKEWQEAQLLLSPKTPPLRKPPHPPPPSSAVRIFSDASWKDDGSAGFGWICKDHLDQTLQEGSIVSSHIRSPLMAEALATLAAVKVAIDSDFTNVFFASDSLNLVKAINSELPHKELHGILHDILSLSSTFAVCSFNFIPRDLNRQADFLAKEALGLVMNSV